MTVKTSNLERVLAGMLISDRLWLKSIYESAADVVRADGLVGTPVIVTLGDWVKIHRSIQNFIWSGLSTVCPAVYPDLVAAIDRRIASEVDTCDGKMTPESRRKLAATLEGIAWAGLGSDE
jgi:hypothetical protein